MLNWTRGLTRTQWLVLLIAWFGWVFDVMDTALFNFAKGPMLTEMLGGPVAYKRFGAAIEGRMMSVFMVGWALGGLVFGLMADRLGRGKTLVITILMYSVLTGFTALCKTPDQVMGLRFLTALGIGGEWAAGAALVAETFPDSGRGPAAGLLQSAAAFGPWFAAAANLALPADSWRLLFLVGVAPALILVAARVLLRQPEPTRGTSGDWATPLREIAHDPRWRKNALVATALGVIGVAGAGIVPFWLPNLIREAGSGLPAEAIKRFTSYNTFTVHVGTLLGVLVFPWLCQRLGRRPSFALFFLLAPLSGALALYGGASLSRLLWLLPLASFFSIGLSAGFVLYFPELFPPRLRATGAGLAYNVGRIFSAALPAVMGGLMVRFQGISTVVLVALGFYVLGVLVIPFAPETKDRPLPV